MWKKLDKSQRGIAFWKCNVISDEEYRDQCRMTVEKCDEGHIAAVCAIYGGMIQSFVWDEEEFPHQYAMLKEELGQLLDEKEGASDRDEAIRELFKRYISTKTYRRKIYELSVDRN